jgi:hypothetical protein
MKLSWDTRVFYPVEKVLKWRYYVDGNGDLRREYLIKWEGYKSSYNSWEPYVHLNERAKAEAKELVRTQGKEVLVVENVNMFRWAADGIANLEDAKSSRRAKRLLQHSRTGTKRRKGTRRGPREYHVEWRGHSDPDSEWVPNAKLKGEARWKAALLRARATAYVKEEEDN